MESIGSLAGGIAHDLNNILFPISGLSEMLLEDIPPDNPAHESIEQIHKSAQRGSDLVKQILAFSRQSNPQETAHPDSADSERGIEAGPGNNTQKY